MLLEKLFRKSAPRGYESPIEKYEIKECHMVESPTGNFIVVGFSYWMHSINHNSKLLVREEEADDIPQRLMMKIIRDRSHKYPLSIEESYEFERIRKELDKFLPKTK